MFPVKEEFLRVHDANPQTDRTHVARTVYLEKDKPISACVFTRESMAAELRRADGGKI